MKKALSILLSILLIALLLLPIASCGGSSTDKQIKYFRKIATAKTIIQNEDIVSYLKKAGFASKYAYKNGEAHIAEDFISRYIETYSLQECLDDIYKVYKEYCYLPSSSMPDSYNFQYLFELLTKEAESEIFSEENEGKKNEFYESNPEALPYDRTTTTSGNLYNEKATGVNDVNIRSEKTNYLTATYYGGFAVEAFDGWRFDKGRLGWSNGKYYDIKPSFKERKHWSLYYNGVVLIEEENEKENVYASPAYAIKGETYTLILCIQKDPPVGATTNAFMAKYTPGEAE